MKFDSKTMQRYKKNIFNELYFWGYAFFGQQVTPSIPIRKWAGDLFFLFVIVMGK